MVGSQGLAVEEILAHDLWILVELVEGDLLELFLVVAHASVVQLHVVEVQHFPEGLEHAVAQGRREVGPRGMLDEAIGLGEAQIDSHVLHEFRAEITKGKDCRDKVIIVVDAEATDQPVPFHVLCLLLLLLFLLLLLLLHQQDLATSNMRARSHNGGWRVFFATVGTNEEFLEKKQQHRLDESVVPSIGPRPGRENERVVLGIGEGVP